MGLNIWRGGYGVLCIASGMFVTNFRSKTTFDSMYCQDGYRRPAGMERVAAERPNQEPGRECVATGQMMETVV